jgi:uncharacterized protein YbjT (DUF2867 family)
MSKLLVVFGATGNQGGSVVSYVLNDPHLSQQFKIRGVTRDPSKPAAQALKEKGVEVVKGDLEDKESLKQALHGAHTVYLVTTSDYTDTTRVKEINEGKAVADAAVTAGVQYFIFSSSPNVAKLSGGKYTTLYIFDGKAEIEEYIRSLPIKSAFVAPGSFMQNLSGPMAPRPVGDGTYAVFNFVSPQTQCPMIEIEEDTGKFVGAILAEPEKYEGKFFSAATALYSFEEVVEIVSKKTGETVKYIQIPESVYRSFLPPVAADLLVEMFSFIQDFGYYGPQSKELVEWTAQNARGKLTTVEEYLTNNPLPLE